MCGSSASLNESAVNGFEIKNLAPALAARLRISGVA
jgi:hypothetical protein